ncbi:hypothetical protein SUGI_0060230 [Cryptomeria japonica]|uniref:uncharacterized protein LOC131071354 n=1 Tax=Cryptomeria japonica TaxID=3369 RepID=UPI002408D01B|nr:uncharacterized protein LOC131071354 [Cryptomeria japonica]GLJ07166.1 hypothetical protein SUGI_0060230 [Cryptomeria japonica]
MASSMIIKIAVFAFTSLVCLQTVLGALTCEELPTEVCAFSVASSGARCVLEKSVLSDGSDEYQCMTSEIIAEKISEWIETEECLNDCGLERIVVGLSSDGLMEYRFTSKLCSPKCYNNCHNIINLYFNLAAGEGVYLPRLCQAHRSGSRRMVQEVLDREQSSITAESFVFASAPSSSQDSTTLSPVGSPVP